MKKKYMIIPLFSMRANSKNAVQFEEERQRDIFITWHERRSLSYMVNKTGLIIMFGAKSKVCRRAHGLEHKITLQWCGRFSFPFTSLSYILILFKPLVVIGEAIRNYFVD